MPKGASPVGVLIIGELRGRQQELCALSQATRGLDLYISTYDEDEDMSRLIASNRRLHLLLMDRTYLTYVDIETSGTTV